MSFINNTFRVGAGGVVGSLITLFSSTGNQITEKTTKLPTPEKSAYYAEVSNSELDSSADFAMAFEYNAKSKLTPFEQWKAQKANVYDRGGKTIRGVTEICYKGLCFQAHLLAQADSIMIWQDATLSDSLKKARTVSIEESPTDYGFYNLTHEQCRFFWKAIWFQCGGNYIKSPKLAMTLCHNIWGSGFGIGIRRFQTVLNSFKTATSGDSTLVDGVLGAKCIGFCNRLNPDSVFNRYVQIRHEAIERDIQYNPNQAVFRVGWHRGVEHIKQSALKWEKMVYSNRAKRNPLYKVQ